MSSATHLIKSRSCPNGFFLPDSTSSTREILDPDVGSRVIEALALFSDIDVEGNGKISFDELRAVMIRNSPEIDEEEIRSVYSSLATGEDGTITQKAFIEGLHKVYGKEKDLDIGNGSDNEGDQTNRRLDDGRRWAAEHVYEGLQNSTRQIPTRSSVSRDSQRRDSSMEVPEDAYQLSQALFRCLDKDRNGMLPVEELKQALSEIDSTMFSNDTLDDIVSLLDDGNTGSVTEEEFTEGFAILAAATSLEQLRENIERYKTEMTVDHSRRSSIADLCLSEEEFCFTEPHEYEDMQNARVVLEDRTYELEEQLQQARASAEKIAKRYSVIQKENQIHCEEKQQLAKQLDLAGSNVRQLEENQEVYKKMCESMKLRLSRLQKDFKNASKQKQEMKEKLLIKQKQLQRELQNKQADLEQAKTVLTHRGKEAKAEKKKLLQKQEIQRKESEKKRVETSEKLTEAQAKIKLLEKQLAEKQKEYEKFVEISNNPPSTPRCKLMHTHSNMTRKVIIPGPHRKIKFPPRTLGDIGASLKMDLENMRPERKRRSSSRSNQKCSRKGSAEGESLSDTKSGTDKGGHLDPQWVPRLERVLKKLKLKRQEQKNSGLKVRKKSEDNFFCDLFSSLFIPLKKSLKECRVDHFFLVRKKTTTKPRRRSLFESSEEKRDNMDPTFVKMLPDLLPLIKVEKEYPSSSVVDWEKSFYLNLITKVFQYSFTIATAQERPSWDNDEYRRVHAIQYISQPIEAIPMYTPRDQKVSPTQHTFPIIYFNVDLVQDGMKDIALSQGQYMAIRLNVSLEFPLENTNSNGISKGHKKRSYACNLLRAKVPYQVINRRFLEARSPSKALSFFRTKEVHNPVKIEYLTLHWMKKGAKEQAQLAIQKYSQELPKRISGLRGRSKSLSARKAVQIPPPPPPSGNALSRWWNAETVNSNIILNPQLTFISIPWNHIVDLVLDVVLPDIK